ncbi:MAG: hypothetical protein GYB37_15945 [Algicola sp.]|nr:hypothetical protein [Algicola sp.]
MRTLFSVFILIFSLSSCKHQNKNINSEEENTTSPKSIAEPGMVTVKTIGMDFIVKDTLNPGWNTFVYNNESTEAHFILMDLYPEGKNAENTKNEVLPPFEEGMKLIMDGDMENAVAAFGKLPAWFPEVIYMGGTGLISPKHTAKSTIFLKPGLYIMECYVKMADGTWHTSHGMYKEIIVTGKNTDLNPPKATVNIDISSDAGIVVADSVPKGKQRFKVTFKDQTFYEHFLVTM